MKNDDDPIVENFSYKGLDDHDFSTRPHNDDATDDKKVKWKIICNNRYREKKM